MKALILNSGVGSRLLPLTEDKPKAFVLLGYGETIIERQLRILERLGIRDVIITTGPFAWQFDVLKEWFPKLQFTFVYNPEYATTNSVYSFYLAREELSEETIVIHGDVVYSYNTLRELLYSTNENAVLVDKNIPKGYKDFLVECLDDRVLHIGVKFDHHTENLCSLKPIYKVSASLTKKWLEQIEKQVEQDNKSIYAEFALNHLLKNHPLSYLSADYYFAEEVDDVHDLNSVSKEITQLDYEEQTVLFGSDYEKEMEVFINEYNLKSPLIVHGKHFIRESKFVNFASRLGAELFSNFSPNPDYKEFQRGLEIFNTKGCDSIIAIGGGSAIDVAKAIKLGTKNDDVTINNALKYVNIPLLAIPTTAGTGTESTRYAVLYKNGVKLSLTHHCIIPDKALLIPSLLKNLPKYHKHSSLLDALFQSIESIWAKAATKESQNHATKALVLLKKNLDSYLAGDESTFDELMLASNLAGRAINISATTAPHALSYGLTSKFGIAHGHAVALVFLETSRITIDVAKDRTMDEKFALIYKSLEQTSMFHVVAWVESLLKRISYDGIRVTDSDITALVENVNAERMLNHPILLSDSHIRKIYVSTHSVKFE